MNVQPKFDTMPPVLVKPQYRRPGFSLLELLICLFVVAVLLGVLLPTLSGARAAGYRSVCATNQRQLGIAFVLYLQDNKETLPQYAGEPEMSDWKYGGAAIAGAAGAAPTTTVLDVSRPINRYVDNVREASPELVMLFSCPADRGVFARAADSATRGAASVLERGTCFREFGTSFRANAMLLDSTIAGIDEHARPLKLSDIATNHSRLLLLGDTAWYYATRDAGKPDTAFEASWHQKQDAGNMLAIDGSTRFVKFSEPETTSFTLHPRGE